MQLLRVIYYIRERQQIHEQTLYLSLYLDSKSRNSKEELVCLKILLHMNQNQNMLVGFMSLNLFAEVYSQPIG